MKKTILAIAMFVASFVGAQNYYVSFGGGAYGAAGVGELTAGGLQGSYGDGYHAQARFGYMFNQKLGVDLGVGYLYGNDQKVMSKGANVIGRARAFGASLAALYNISDNVYVRAGVLSKLGGKTEVEASVKSGPVAMDIKRENTGSLPVGFIGAFGVKFKIAEKWSVFAEMEYQGINVPANESVLTGVSGAIGGQKFSDKAGALAIVGALPAAAQAQIAPLLQNPLLADKITYADNPDRAKFQAKSFDAPYSSFGINVGFTYSFNW